MGLKSPLHEILKDTGKTFTQKVPVVFEGLRLEIAAHSEVAIGQVFDHLPLADLQAYRRERGDQPAAIDYHIHWVDAGTYGFSAREWTENADEVFHAFGRSTYLKKNFTAICEGRKIFFISSYDNEEGLIDFLKWLKSYHNN